MRFLCRLRTNSCAVMPTHPTIRGVSRNVETSVMFAFFGIRERTAILINCRDIKSFFFFFLFLW